MCCFWSAQCIETQARTPENLKNCVYKSLNVQWWSLLDNFVFCKILRSIKTSWTRKSNVYRRNSCSDVYYHHSWSLFILTVNIQRHFIINVTWRWIVRQNGFDNRKWLCEFYRSQPNSQIHKPCSWSWF